MSPPGKIFNNTSLPPGITMARSISLYVRAVPGVPPLLTVLHDRLEEGNSSYSQDSRWETVRRGGLQVETPTWEQGLKHA